MKDALNNKKKSKDKAINERASDAESRSAKKTILYLGIFIVLALLGGGLSYFWFFIQRQLTPIVEKNLTSYLNRPIHLGEVEGFSFTGVRFGATEMPPTPNDPDRVSLKAVDVAFNPVQLLARRTLKLNLNLIKPDIYIEQDLHGVWVSTTLAQIPPGALTIDLQTIRFKDARVTIVPRSGDGSLSSPVTGIVNTGKSRFSDGSQRIQFHLAGKLNSGGKFKLKGKSQLSANSHNLVISGKNLDAKELNSLIPFPFDIPAGTVAGDLEIELKNDSSPKYFGTASFTEAAMKLPQLPKAFTNGNGEFKIQRGYH